MKTKTLDVHASNNNWSVRYVDLVVSRPMSHICKQRTSQLYKIRLIFARIFSKYRFSKITEFQNDFVTFSVRLRMVPVSHNKQKSQHKETRKRSSSSFRILDVFDSCDRKWFNKKYMRLSRTFTHCSCLISHHRTKSRCIRLMNGTRSTTKRGRTRHSERKREKERKGK